MSALADGIDYDPQSLYSKKSEVNVQKFLKDDRGKLVINEEVHNIMHRFRRIAHRKGYKRLLILGAFSMGKCMISLTKVLMYDCSVKIVDDIKVGDLLMGDDGTPRKVLFLGRGIEQAYKITLKNGDSFTCNESHILSLKVSNRVSGYTKGDIINIPLKEYLELPNWIKLNCLKMYKVPLNFKEQNVGFDPYVYGVWLGDGHKTGLHFTINNKDKEIVNYLFNWSKKNKLEVRIDEQIGDCKRYDFGKGKDNSLSYNELSFVKKSIINDEKRIRKEYLQNSREVRLQLLAGLLDTDGYSFDKCFEIATKYEGLCDDILFLCRSLGFKVSYSIKEVNNKLYYRITISGDTHLIPCKTRKKVKQRKKNKNPLVYNFTVEPIGEKEYFGFGLDGNHLFLHHDFTVLHNTEQMCIGLVLEQIARNPNMFIKIVHISEKEAINRVRAIADYIKNDKDYQNFAPNVKPTSIWGQEKFIVKRDTISQNPTVAAYGVLASGLGGRAHMIIFDDINDLKSAVLEPTTRENVEQMVRTTWNTRLIPNNSECIVLMNRWHESLHKSTKLVEINGLKNINKFKIGDMVLTSNGIYEKVLKTHKGLYKGKLYKIIPHYFTPFNFECTHDHEILLRNGWYQANKLTKEDYLVIPIPKFKGDWKKECLEHFIGERKYKSKKPKMTTEFTTKQNLIRLIKEGLTYKKIGKQFNISDGTVYNLVQQYKINTGKFNNIDKEIFDDIDFWRILGYWVAEGSFTESRKGGSRDIIRFSFGAHEIKYINEVKNFFNKYDIYIGEDYTNRNSCNLKVSCRQLAIWIKKNFDEFEHKKRLPSWFFGLPEEQFMEFMIGYSNGDGYINKKEEYNIISVSKTLLFQIQLNLLRFGIISQLNKGQKGGIKTVDFGWGEHEINCRDSYNLKITNDLIEQRFAYIEEDKLYVKIKDIKVRDYFGYVYDITTPSHDFISPFIVHNSDFANYVIHNPMWAWMSIEVAEDKNNLIYKDSFGKIKDLPLWTKFSKDALIGKHIEMGDRDYKRGYELKPYSDSDKTFPNFEDCCRYGINPELMLGDFRDWVFGAGIDFAGTKRPGTVMVIIGMNKNTGIKVPVRLYALSNPSELPNKIVEAWKDFGCFFIAENNAVQEALIEMLQTTLDRSVYGRYNIKIDAFNTGKNKADPISGLPSIQKEFEKNEWIFCFPQKYGLEEGVNEKDLWNRFYHEWKHAPFFKTTDFIMAGWFCREGLKNYQRNELSNWIY